MRSAISVSLCGWSTRPTRHLRGFKVLRIQLVDATHYPQGIEEECER
jgi:hypothetical protein